MIEDKIGEAFGLDPDKQYLDKMKPAEIEAHKNANEESDYDFVRDNMKDLIAKGTSAFDDLLDLAKQSENARIYEVLSGLMKTIGDQNKDLIDIESKIKGSKKEETSTPTNIENALFVGSTAELLKGLKDGNDQ